MIYTETYLKDRIQVLRNVYRYTLKNGGLSIGQRICLKQEQAALMHCQDHLQQNPLAVIKPRYEIPKHLNERVLFINIRARHMY